MRRNGVTLRMVESPPGDPLDAHVARLTRLTELHRRLHCADTVGGLFAAATDLVTGELEYDRGVIVSAGPGVLTAETMESVRNPASDRLRRQVLADPVRVRPGGIESEMIRMMGAARRVQAPSQSALGEALELRHAVLAPIVVESRTLAILVLERAAPAVSSLDVGEASVAAELIAVATERMVVRARERALAAEIQNLATSTQAFMREMLDAPVTLPAAGGRRETFPQSTAARIEPGSLRDLLDEREARIAALLVAGRSNRQIAEELILSPETVKGSVARMLRKLGVSNRVAAATRILELSREQR